jgi:peroxiredoxin
MPDDAPPLALITAERVTPVPAVVDEDARVWVDAGGFEAATGWTSKPVGLCRDDECIPADLNPGLRDGAGRIDLGRFAELSQGELVVDIDERVAVLAPSARARLEALRAGQAPPFALPDLDGELVSSDDLFGQKTLVVAFASWCGCRHDLPAWQELHDELRPEGFGVVAIAIDEDPEEVRPFAAGTTYPVLIDRDRVFAGRYALTNVPTVLWIDEERRIVRPHDVAFGSDLFKEFHKVESTPHHDALRRWVRDGEQPAVGAAGDPGDDAAVPAWEPTAEEHLAHLHYRLALHLWRDGREEAAIRHFDRASELAPLDFTVRRAQLPLRGKDPFLGEEFLELYAEWEQAGQPYYGRTRS